MTNRYILLAGVAAALLGLALEGNGNDRPAAKASPAPHKKMELPAFTPERETAALRFVDEHHPELRAVLDRVGNLNRQQYEQAIRELFQESDRLALVKKNDEALYLLMLESWQVKSRSEVLAARLACTTDGRADLEQELKKLLYRQVDLHRLVVEHNRRRALATLKVMEANIELLRDKRDDIVERRFQSLTARGKVGMSEQQKATKP